MWPEDEVLLEADYKLQAFDARPMDLGDGSTLAHRVGSGTSGPIAPVAVLQVAESNPNTLASSAGMFGSRLFPPNMSSIVRHRLHEMVAKHKMHLKPDDFDDPILIRLANMPEARAMRVLQIAANVNWHSIQNNTKYLMTLCCRTA